MDELTQKRRGRPPKIDAHSTSSELVGYAEKLEAACEIRAGAMDSERRHDEIAAQLRSVMLEVAADLRLHG